MIHPPPYISFVVTSRNDNHGDRLLFRMQTFVDCLLDQCRRYELPAELLIIEWNPPEDQPSLAKVLNWGNCNRYCEIRILQVPPHIHRRFENSEKLPLFQMIAKNAGIRRAAAPFVLATNIDILFSEELMRFLASRQLKENRLYRVDRCDIPAALPVTPSVPELLDFCANNVTRIYTRWGAKDARTGKFDEGSVTWKTVVHDLLTVISGDVAEKRLHTQACGDFTLLAKTRWCAIRGYAELPMLAMHIDSLACQTAYFSGAKEWILTSPRRIYHIEHSASPGWKAEGDGALMAMMNPGGIPQLGYMRYQEFAIRMRRERRPMIFNGEDWGLAGEPLPEMTVC